jgi:hypothetical protein
MIPPPSNLSENIFSTTKAATGIVEPAHDRGDAGASGRALTFPKRYRGGGGRGGVKVRGGVYHPLYDEMGV